MSESRKAAGRLRSSARAAARSQAETCEDEFESDAVGSFATWYEAVIDSE